jgi:hypothetical protein
MKLFDYDSHASAEAKKLSNPNRTANLKILGLPDNRFIKAEISIYLHSDLNSSEFTFTDVIDSFESNDNLYLVTNDESKEIYFVQENDEWCFYFRSSPQNEIKKQFKLKNGDEKIWILSSDQNSSLEINGSFLDANIKIKKVSSCDINDDLYIYIKCTLTREDNKSGTVWGRILLKKELPDDAPNLSLNYYVTL